MGCRLMLKIPVGALRVRKSITMALMLRESRLRISDAKWPKRQFVLNRIIIWLVIVELLYNTIIYHLFYLVDGIVLG